MLVRVRAALAAICFSILTVIALAQSDNAPSLMIVNARVFTGVAATPWAEAVSVVGERIGVVGTSEAVRKLAGSKTRVIDGGGRVVIPGVNDAHTHVAVRPAGVSLEGPPAIEHDPTFDEIMTRLKVAAAKAPKDSWIYGEIGAVVLDDPKATRAALDAVAPDHFVMLTAWTGHGSLLNTAALRRLNVRDDEPDPPGGFFVRLPGTRTITGVMHEYARYMLGGRILTLAGEQAQLTALRSYANEAVGFGITSAQVMAPADFAKTAMAADVPLRLRIVDFPTTGLGAWREPASGRVKGAGRVTISGTKWILDGTPVERLMFLRQPYSDKAATTGQLNFPAAQVTGFLKTALAHRDQPMFHAVGDAAIDTVLAGLEASGGAAWQPLRPRIEHGDMTEPAHFERMKRLGVIVVQNPSHFMLPAVMGARLGSRTARVTMMKSMLAAGVPVALGSDGPMNPYLNLIFATINANNPSEAMTREQALAAYTLGAARAEFQELQKGTISPGMLADLAMLSQDIFTAAPDALPKTASVLTLVGGRIVHESR